MATYMNDYDIARASELLRDDEVLAPAVRTLRSLQVWTNDNSDGWAYWVKPSRAAAQLQGLVADALTAYYRGDKHTATAADVKRALAPVKAFRTRQKADFEIYCQ
jgi:hypothetical protein